jgi:hypothetical protein
MVRATAAVVALACALHARAEERPTRPVPALKAAPKIDGDLGDWKGALELAPASGASAVLRPRAGVSGSSVLFAVEVEDDQVGPGDLLDVSLFFPGAGPAARGFTFRIAYDGPRAFDDEAAAPAYAQRQLEARVQRTGKGLSVEAQLPARALPAFPARGPLAFDLCLTYQDRDAVGGRPTTVQSCSGGSMGKTALALPDAFRAALKVKAPDRVVALEGRPGGWVGYGARHELAWARGDEPLTEPSLAALVTDLPVKPEAIGMAPPHLVLEAAGRKPIFSVLSGKDPQPGDVPCDAGKEVRLSLFLVDGRTALLVLECPAVTCALGRATAVVLDDEGSLSIGYSSGMIATYSWSTDHFERTEYGMLER